MHLDLDKIIQRIKDGEEEAFNILYQAYYPSAYRIAFQITRSDADAKDAVQESFIQIRKSMHQLEDTKKFYSWMSRIILSKCSRIFEKNHYQAVDPEIIAIKNQNPEQRKYMIPKKIHDYVNEREVLYDLMDQMKPKHREVLQLMYFEQLQIKEIAAYLNISENTVKSRLLRGREELKAIILRYEKKEGRKLEFSVESAFVLSGVGLFAQKLDAWKTKTVKWLTGNGIIAGCAVSYVALIASGVVMVQKNAQKEQDQENAVVQNQPTIVHETILGSHTATHTFVQTSYQNKPIQTPIEAYYTLRNWADDLEQMQEKTEEERDEIQSVYQALKDENGMYYQKLLEDGWVDCFESL